MDANKRRERAAAEAAEWWIRFDSGELSRAEREEFVDWLRESATHVAEMIRMAELHGGLERFNQWERVSTEGWDAPENVVALDEASSRRTREESSSEESRAARRGWQKRGWLAAAAAVLVVFGVWMIVAAQAQIIETGRGERRGVTLADGSVIQIDPQSRLRIRLEKRVRNISLERGRVLFRVAHDVQRPFIVQAGATQVRAVGTQFGVEQAREGIIVTVAEGKVMVTPKEDSGLPFGGGSTSAPTPLLSAGQQLTVPKEGPATAVKRVDSERELAWAAGRLVFDNESVADIVEQFNRYNVVQLHVSDRQLAAREVSGVFDASEPESFIGFIQSVVPVRVTRAGQDITIASTP